MMTIAHPTWGFDMFGPATRALMPAIAASGVGFAGGYLWSGAKGMTRESVHLLSSAGLRILSYYEVDDKLASFSADKGKRDAAGAVKNAQALGQPRGSSIFFAVDLDESKADYAAHIRPHFESLNRELEGQYEVEGYGSGLTLESLLADGLITHSVLGAIGWRDGHKFLPLATVVQKPPSDPYHFGIEVDPLFSQNPLITPFTWSTAVPIEPDPPVDPDDQVYSRDMRMGSRGDDVRVLQAMLGAKVDGIWGPETEKRVQMYRRVHKMEDGAPLRLEMVAG
jgi:hypothetical protein